MSDLDDFKLNLIKLKKINIIYLCIFIFLCIAFFYCLVNVYVYINFVILLLLIIVYILKKKNKVKINKLSDIINKADIISLAVKDSQSKLDN